MEMGASCPDQFASILRMDNAALSRHEKSLVVASYYESLRFGYASANLRRLLGSRASGSRRDALLSEEAAEPRASNEDLDILSARGKPKEQGVGKKEEEGPLQKGRGQGERG